MKNILILISLVALIIFSGCEKKNAHKVTYYVTNSQQGFTASYLDETGTLQTEYISTQSASEKKIIKTYWANAGDIVYISVRDTATYSFVKATIFVDDKVYKEASRTDDKTKPLTVSGTIPY
ncbi:MAG TPA: hypothetical protein PLT47_04350 [Bacteroidales bacterium]|mgnify:FL=1|nr:hypothetical protein [Bacteroidales bacterium]HQI69956.1 hypothetical protein [Bacteroidales bacterium]